MHLDSLTLQTTDLDLLLPFYRDVLELPVQQENETLRIQAGATTLQFQSARSTDDPARYHFAFNIPANRLPEAKQWVQSRVALIRDRNGDDAFFSEEWNADNIYFRDPAGNILELIARHNLENTTEAPFGPNQIRNISEIGVVPEDVSALREQLQREAALEPYRSFSDEFAAVGDETGLFVIAAPGREWNPDSGLAAAPYPLEVQFRNNQGQRFRLVALPYRLLPAGVPSESP
ncbi:MAG: hypothetical protein OHK0029_26810 [Armatimonadaceae bacterium]